MSEVLNLEKTSSLVSELIKDVNTTQIPIKPIEPEKKLSVDYINYSKQYWENKSNELYNRFLYGNGLGKYGNNKNDVSIYYKRLSEALIEITKNECISRGKTTEDLSCYFNILSSIMILIGNALKQKEVPNNAFTLLASLHGFVESYNKEIGG